VKYNPFVTFLLSCSVLLFSRSNDQLEPRNGYSRFMAQMTWFSTRMVLFRYDDEWYHSGEMCPNPSHQKRGRE